MRSGHCYTRVYKMPDVLNSIEQQIFLDQLFELLRIPSISALSEHKQDVLSAAEWVADYAKLIGFRPTEIKMLCAKGVKNSDANPVVFASRVDDPGNPTVMIYGHYDVQPPDPIADWESDPFDPQIRDGNIYARGATDNKGQMFTHLAALRHLAQEWGKQWPINVKLLIEGEEEVGSKNINRLIEQYADSDKFAADMCLISDGPWVTKDDPTIEYGLKGIAYMQIDVRLADADLHSGLFGGGVLNPANALTQILAQLQDRETSKVLVPGFYDEVVGISEIEKKELSESPLTEEEFLNDAANSKAVWGEEGYSLIERVGARPTLDINGIWSGFQGEGTKTIIPATAHAKVSMRLVANQDPLVIAELFTKYVKDIADPAVDVDVSYLHGGDAVYVDLDSPYIKLAADAMEQAFGKTPIFSRSGGSIPAVAKIQNKLGVTPILINYGQPDDALHSPNEKLSKSNFINGINCSIRILELLSDSN